MTTADTHDLTIVRDEQRRRGWYLSWRCPTKGCNARGNATLSGREKAMDLFEVVAEGHKRSEADR